MRAQRVGLPLVERKTAVGDRTSCRYSRESVSASGMLRPSLPQSKPSVLPARPTVAPADSRALFTPANRGAASKAPRFIRRWRRFGAFPIRGSLRRATKCKRWLILRVGRVAGNIGLRPHMKYPRLCRGIFICCVGKFILRACASPQGVRERQRDAPSLNGFFIVRRSAK